MLEVAFYSTVVLVILTGLAFICDWLENRRR